MQSKLSREETAGLFQSKICQLAQWIGETETHSAHSVPCLLPRFYKLLSRRLCCKQPSTNHSFHVCRSWWDGHVFFSKTQCPAVQWFKLQTQKKNSSLLRVISSLATQRLFCFGGKWLKVKKYVLLGTGLIKATFVMNRKRTLLFAQGSTQCFVHNF